MILSRTISKLALISVTQDGIEFHYNLELSGLFYPQHVIVSRDISVTHGKYGICLMPIENKHNDLSTREQDVTLDAKTENCVCWWFDADSLLSIDKYNVCEHKYRLGNTRTLTHVNGYRAFALSWEMHCWCWCSISIPYAKLFFAKYHLTLRVLFTGRIMQMPKMKDKNVFLLLLFIISFNTLMRKRNGHHFAMHVSELFT